MKNLARKQDSLEDSLHEVFGLSHLRPGQEEVIQNVLNERDTLAVMPTGSGQIPLLSVARFEFARHCRGRLASHFADEDQAEKLTEIRSVQRRSTVC
jgi:ATP-dependent DNA helicase RecQ